MRVLALFVVVSATASKTDEQLTVLRALYKATGGESWTNNEGWNDPSSDDYCSWYGVSCPLHVAPSVQGISLPSNGMSGSLPAEIIGLSDLKSLDLHDNKIGGSIPPKMETLGALETFDLGYNKLTGGLPSDFWNLTESYPTLKEIHLSYNDLSGVIPEEFFGPPTLPIFYPPYNLQVLDLSWNGLTGGIPTRILRCDSMRSLLFVGNKMSGSVSDTMDTYLSHLKYCDTTGQKFDLNASVANCMH